MKKARLFTFLILIATLAVFMLVGCQNEDKIASVSLKGNDPNSAIEVALGAFNCNDYTLVVSYESGTIEEVPLTENMIEEADFFKFYQVGDHDITISYNKQKYEFKISIKRSTFENLSFPEKSVFTYDGKEHIIEVEGDLPGNAVVTYPGGNSFINAGIYDVTAIVSCEGYVTERLSTTVTIERATYDMSGVKFEAKEFVYDGSAHSVGITGTLPEGVPMPIYTINEKTTASAISVGEYTVKAVFTNTNSNYEPIPTMETTLKIIPAEYVIKGIDIAFKGEDGKVIYGREKSYDGSSVTFDLNDYTKLSSKISVSFSVYDEEGKLISNSNKITNIKDAGVYTVKAEFSMSDSKNYKPIDPIVCEFEITKKDYVLENVTFVSDSCLYDEEAHSLKIQGELPKGVTVSYEYYLGDTLIVDKNKKPVQEVTDVGRYTVKAVFTHTDGNCKEIEPLTATLQISPIYIDTSGFEVEFTGTTIYDGTEKYVSLIGTLPTGVEIQYEYYLDDKILKNEDGTPVTSVVNAGNYTVNIIFVLTDENSTHVGLMVYMFSIDQISVDIDNADINNVGEHIYNGRNYRPTLETVFENVNITETLYRIDDENNRTEVESAVECGRYVLVFTVMHENNINYNIIGNAEREEEFSIVPQTVALSGVSFGNNELPYNGSAQYPSLSGIPEHVQFTVNIYSLEGAEPQKVDSAINMGSYRCEVIFSIEDPNYAFPSNANNVFTCDFSIVEVVLDVSEIKITNADGKKYEYKGSPVALVFENALPEWVELKYIKGGTVFDEVNALGIYKLAVVRKDGYSPDIYKIVGGTTELDCVVFDTLTVYSTDLGTISWHVPEGHPNLDIRPDGSIDYINEYYLCFSNYSGSLEDLGLRIGYVYYSISDGVYRPAHAIDYYGTYAVAICELDILEGYEDIWVSDKLNPIRGVHEFVFTIPRP